jgi:glycosyltransferase involved in cell wall biosynthesis
VSRPGPGQISFIVPAHNEELLLGHTLEALHAAGQALGAPYEIVVADDASDDATGAVAESHDARVVRVERRQIAAARNAGAAAARGEIFIFVDADTVVTPAVVRAAVRAVRRGAAGGGCAFRFDGPIPLYARLLHRLATPIGHALGLAGGCFLFCSRAAFRAAGGFSEEVFAAEEVSFATGLKRQGRFVMLRECVTTSGRKVRTHSARAILKTLLRLALYGPKTFRQREDLWYGQRRADPGA